MPTKDKAPTIDGNLSDWDLSGQIQSYRDTSIRSTYSVKTAAMWDADNLYMCFEWRDPSPLNSRINPKENPGRGWQADAEQLRVLGDHNEMRWFTFWSYQGRVNALEYVQRRVPPGQTARTDVLIADEGSSDLGQGAESAYRLAEDGNGFIHEVKIPWALVFTDGREVSAGTKIRCGMEFLWGNVRGEGMPEHRCVDNMQPGVLTREFYWEARNAWGDLTLRNQSVAEKRRYVPDSGIIAGTIPLEIQVPESAGLFTVAIDDAEGRRIRNLAGGADPELYAVGESVDGRRTLRVMWDGLDDQGALVAPGTYSFHGLALGGNLKGRYEMTFYNPGTPAWQTTDGTGTWGADHTPVRMVRSSGDRMILLGGFAEGGSGTFALGPEGRKVWGESKGAGVAAANSEYVFTTPNDWSSKGTNLLRMDSATGDFAPFVRDGAELAMPYPLADLYGENNGEEGDLKKLLAMAATDRVLAVLREDGRLLVVDPETGVVRKTFSLEVPEDGIGGFRVKDNTLFWFDDTQLRTLDLASGEPGDVALTNGPQKPVSLAFDAAGDLYVADAGSDMQVKKYGPDGRLLQTFGTRGGRPRTGPFEPGGLYALSSADVDSQGNVWAVEYTHFPRRVAVWSPEGRFLRDYIGNTPYAASTSFLHSDDPTLGYVEGNEVKLDPATGEWEIQGVVWNPDPEKGLSVGSANVGYSGQVFHSDASGQEREYYVPGPRFGYPLTVFMRPGPDAGWRPVCGIFNLAALRTANFGGNYYANATLPAPEGYEDCDPADTVIWTDANADGYVQRGECEIVPAAEKTILRTGDERSQRGKRGTPALALFGAGWSRHMDRDDFGFFAAPEAEGLWKVVPDAFSSEGVPQYSAASWHQIPLDGWRISETCPVPNSDTVVAEARKTDTRNNWYIGVNKKTGAIQWRYPSPYNGVHASHNAPMASPGLLIGPLKITGVVPDCGDAPGVFMIRGNLGEDYWITTDGLFVSPFFKDTRLPTAALPDTEEALKEMPMELFSGGSEHFCGWTGRHRDGVVRMSCGVSREAAMIVRMEGLDEIDYLTPATVEVTATRLADADHDNQARKAAEANPLRPYKIASTRRDADGALEWGQVESLRVHKAGMAETAEVQLCYDATNLYARFQVNDTSTWLNAATDPALLFKGGDAVDVQLSPGGDSSGPVRFVCAPFKGKASVLEMRQKAGGPRPFGAYTYSSPVATAVFEQVGLNERIEAVADTRGGGYTVTLAIPWTQIGAEPTSGMKMRGDVGMICSDAAGKTNVARVYWAKQNTGLVKDIPNEARFGSGGMGEWTLE